MVGKTSLSFFFGVLAWQLSVRLQINTAFQAHLSYPVPTTEKNESSEKQSRVYIEYYKILLLCVVFLTFFFIADAQKCLL